MEHTIRVLNTSSGEEVHHKIHVLHMTQIKSLQPFFNAEAPVMIPIEVENYTEAQAMNAMITWLKRDAPSLQVDNKKTFRALAIFADKFDVQCLREALTVCLFRYTRHA